MSADRLYELMSLYEKVIKDLNSAIDEEVKVSYTYELARAEVTKLKHNKRLIEESIMSEKKLIDANR